MSAKTSNRRGYVHRLIRSGYFAGPHIAERDQPSRSDVLTLRNPMATPKKEDTLNIVVAGDSFVFNC